MNNETPLFTFNTNTKEFSVLGHKFEGVNSIEDFINYIHNLDEENKELEEKEELHLNRIDELVDRVVKLETNWNELKKELNTYLEMGGFNSYGITCALGCIHKIEDRCSDE